jgi:hypothetical protein
MVQQPPRGSHDNIGVRGKSRELLFHRVSSYEEAHAQARVSPQVFAELERLERELACW